MLVHEASQENVRSNIFGKGNWEAEGKGWEGDLPLFILLNFSILSHRNIFPIKKSWEYISY